MAEPKKKKPTRRKAANAAKSRKAAERTRPSSREEGASSVKPASSQGSSVSPFVSGEDAYGEEAMAKRELAGRAADRAEARAEAKRVRRDARSAGSGSRAPLTPRKVLTIVLLVLLAAVVIVVAAFSWNRWLRYDDAADFQGLWNYADGAVQVKIDGEEIQLTEDAAYSYELDTFSKSITLTFGDLSGHGVYEFSEDRNVLVIVDGRSPDIGSVLGLTDVAEGASDSVTKLIRVGELPAGESGASSSSAPAAGASSQGGSSAASSSEDSTAEDAGSSSGADAEGSDGAQDVQDDAQGSTGKTVDSLGSDPGAGAGSNVVTPEDIGVTAEDASSSEGA